MIEKLENGITELPNGVKVVVSTPHPVNFYHEESDGNCFVVMSSGVLVNARPIEEVINDLGTHQLVKTKFVGDSETENTLRDLHAANPGLIVIGSIIAAQAYPGLVYGLVPAPGFERVPPAEKRMSMEKFNSY